VPPPCAERASARGQVEAEAVHAHLGDPVAQRVGDQPEHVRSARVEGVAAAGEVGVAARVPLEPVVAAVVDAAQREGRAQLARLGGVVVDDVEDHLDPGGVQGAHHPPELAHLLAPGAGGGVPGVRGEVADGVVAPVVAQAPPQQMVLVRELVHRQQLHGRHPEPGQMRDRGGVREPGVRAAQPGRDAGVAHGEAAHMEFVDHRLGPGGLGAAVVGPLVGRAARGVVADDHALGDVRGRVALVPYGVGDVLLRPVPHMPVDLGGQRTAGRPEVAVHGARVRIQQQLGRVPAGAGPRVPAAVHAEAVPAAGQHSRHEAVPDLMGRPGQRVADLRAVVVEQAQLDGLRAARPQREVGAGYAAGPAVHARAERLRTARPDGRAGRGGAAARGGQRRGHGGAAHGQAAGGGRAG
jgi:hypothetical protein